MLCKPQSMVSSLRVASWLQNNYCGSGSYIRVPGRKQKEGRRRSSKGKRRIGKEKVKG